LKLCIWASTIAWSLSISYLPWIQTEIVSTV
jgi:hypothetical protein